MFQIILPKSFLFFQNHYYYSKSFLTFKIIIIIQNHYYYSKWLLLFKKNIILHLSLLVYPNHNNYSLKILYAEKDYRVWNKIIWIFQKT